MVRAQDIVEPTGAVVRRKPVVGDLRWEGQEWKRWSGRRWVRAAYSVDPDRLKQPLPLHHEVGIGEERRHDALVRAVEDQVVHNSARVVFDGPGGTVLAYRRGVSHFLHAVLTLFTGGLWAVVWLASALGRRDDRIRLEADAWGHVWARSVSSA